VSKPLKDMTSRAFTRCGGQGAGARYETASRTTPFSPFRGKGVREGVLCGVFQCGMLGSFRRSGTAGRAAPKISRYIRKIV
jgi:hypothetical protein